MSLENMMEPTGELSSDQIGAIKQSVRIGSLLVNDHPEIAELYRDGMTHSGIAARLDVKREYDISSDKVAETSIHHAITGHAGGFGTESYDGLISDLDELAGLEHEHRANGGRKSAELGLGIHAQTPEQRLEYGIIGGRIATELGLGIHGLTPEQKSEYGIIGGRIGGRKSAELGLGIHALTPEQKSEYGIIGGRIATLARGQTPWGEEETGYAHLLSLEPEFQHQKGPHKGKGDYKTIAQVLNEDYHNGEEVRSPGAVKINLFNYRKTLEN